MKNYLFILLSLSSIVWYGCKDVGSTTQIASPETQAAGQSAVVDPDSKPNIVQTAVGSPDHTTLVTAVKAAGLVDALSNAGPFTVFAPTNAAFDKLPAGTVESLLKPENKSKLTDI
nr:fasciclin domain-containing protein [Saprospiraceae bacterium]